MGIFTKSTTDDNAVQEEQVTETNEVTTVPAEGIATPVDNPVEPNITEPEEVHGDAQEPALMQVTLDQLINLAIEKGASDIHFGEDARIALRVEGKILFIENADQLSREGAQSMLDQMMDEEIEKIRFAEEHELDFSYTHNNGVNFRVNAFTQQGKIAVVMRMISKHIPTLDELGTPEEVKSLLSVREGLILVCGPAGSGKSTSVQAMLEYINQNFVKHVVTIENPVEYIFDSKQSMFTQREIGKDALNLTQALESAAHQDANVIMIDEIKDLETLEEILTLVETGHLVMASLTTKDARQTLERMLSMFPEQERSLGAQRIAENLLCILSQDLVTKADQTGRAAVYEFLLNNPQVSNSIHRGRFDQIRTIMQSGASQGMITLDAYARQLAEQGIIDAETAQEFAEAEEQL